MKHTTQPIPLTPSIAADDDRPIKHGALAVFRLLRSGIEQAKTVPGLLQQAATDIREAWEESSRPNA